MKRAALFVAVLLLPALASGEVAKVTIANRVTVANGQAFGATGPYEKLTGTIEFALDPKDPHNARVTDLDRAKRGADGRVHFTSDVIVMRPVDQGKGNGVLLFEVSIAAASDCSAASTARRPARRRWQPLISAMAT
jgi:hypothetical protein